MSEKLGITQSQYSNIENGETDHTKYLRPISEIFGCKPNEVISGQVLKDRKRILLTIQQRKHSVSITIESK